MECRRKIPIFDILRKIVSVRLKFINIRLKQVIFSLIQTFDQIIVYDARYRIIHFDLFVARIFQ